MTKKNIRNTHMLSFQLRTDDNLDKRPPVKSYLVKQKCGRPVEGMGFCCVFPSVFFSPEHACVRDGKNRYEKKWTMCVTEVYVKQLF